jgi:hypothetical protein
MLAIHERTMVLDSWDCRLLEHDISSRPRQMARKKRKDQHQIAVSHYSNTPVITFCMKAYARYSRDNDGFS